jgi:hypothetical protein
MDDSAHTGRNHQGTAGDGDLPKPDRATRFAELRAAIQQGIDDGDAGRVVDLDEAFDQVEAMLDEMEAAQRA